MLTVFFERGWSVITLLSKMLAEAAGALIALRPRQLLAHQPMQQADRLERADHHLEMRDQTAVVVEGDDVDAVDPDAVDLVLELQHRAVVAAPFADILETGAAQNLLRAGQILRRYL